MGQWVRGLCNIGKCSSALERAFDQIKTVLGLQGKHVEIKRVRGVEMGNGSGVLRWENVPGLHKSRRNKMGQGCSSWVRGVGHNAFILQWNIC